MIEVERKDFLMEYLVREHLNALSNVLQLTAKHAGEVAQLKQLAADNAAYGLNVRAHVFPDSTFNQLQGARLVRQKWEQMKEFVASDFKVGLVRKYDLVEAVQNQRYAAHIRFLKEMKEDDRAADVKAAYERENRDNIGFSRGPQLRDPKYTEQAKDQYDKWLDVEK